MRREYQQAPQVTESISPPKLLAFRSLQFYALLCACIWILTAAISTKLIVDRNFKDELTDEHKLLNKEAGYLLSAIEQTMHQAEQLSNTLSFDQSILTFAKTANSYSAELETLEESAKIQLLLTLPGAKEVNNVFAQLALHMEMEQIFLLDKNGNCVGSSRAEFKDGCLGGNYTTRDYFQTAQQLNTGRQFAIGRVMPTPSFFFSTAVKENNIFIGAVVVRLKVKQIDSLLSHLNLMAAMTEKNGIVLSSSRRDLSFKQIAADGQHLPSKEDIQNIFRRDEIQTVPMQFLAAPLPELKLIFMDGKRYLIAWRNFAAEDFFVYIFSPVDHLYNSMKKSWGLAGIIIVLGLSMILLVERNFNYTQHRLAHLNALSEANKNLSLASQELYFLSVTDVLTGIANRRFFTQRLDEEIERRQRNLEPDYVPHSNANTLALLAIDIDFFKKINDTYGHPAGDEAIRTLANICKQTIRPYDVLGRIGGEEFAILLIDTNLVQAQEIAERIRKVCATTYIIDEGREFNQTCSIGIALFNFDETAEQLLSNADRALYSAKNQGRNCTHVFSDITPQNLV